MRVLLIILALALAGCAHADRSVPVVVCAKVKVYTPEEQKAAAEALRALPEGNPLARFMTDYGQLRAELRACHGR